jgi:hypothetical protein
VYSDDHGETWSQPVNVSPPHANTQNSTPMLRPNGTIVDAYIDFGNQVQEDEDIEFRHDDEAAAHREAPAHRSAAAHHYPVIRTAISRNGGDSFHSGGVVTSDVGGGPTGIRCCLDSATSDPATGRLFVAWNGINLAKVRLSSSTDGKHWTKPVVVDPSVGNQRYGVNVDVAARAGKVAVSYGLTNADKSRGRFAQQYIATSKNGGTSFARSLSVGPRSNYAYAARAGGIFPGDYIGTALAENGVLYAVWCVSRKPPTADARFHQVVEGAVLKI